MSEFRFIGTTTSRYLDWDASNNTFYDSTTATDSYDGRLLERANPQFYSEESAREAGLTKGFLEQFEQAKQDYLDAHTCPYCGCRYQDDGKPNCSQCGAPKRGG